MTGGIDRAEADGGAQQLPPDAPPPRDRWAPALFVWAVWGFMFLVALAYVARYGGRAPYFDDWTDMAVWTGEEPVTGAWLWAQHAEHRIPLPKLILAGLYRLSSYDFRAGIAFNAAVLGVMAAAFIRAAARLRGGTSYADAFFPLTLLSLGQYQTFQIGHGVDFVTATALAGVFLFLIARSRTPLTPWAAAGAAACLGAMALCGAMGLVLIPPLTLWLVYSGVCRLRSPGAGGKRAGLLTLALAAVPPVLVGVYFLGYQRPSATDAPPSPGLGAAARTTAEYLGAALGPAAEPFWPFSALAVAGLLGLSTAALVVVWWKRPGERFRAAGLLLFMGAMACLALAVGWGRAGFGRGAGFQSRYMTYAAPALCCAYLAWGLCRSPALASFPQTCLFTLLAAVSALNTQVALREGWGHRRQMEAFEQDLKAGLPPSALAGRHAPFLFPWPPDDPDTGVVASGLRALQRAGVRRFQQMPGDPAMTEVRVPVVPTATREVTWDPGRRTGQSLGKDPQLTFALDGPRMVYAVRVTYSVTPEGEGPGPGPFRVSWKRADQATFPDAQSRSKPVPGPGTAGATTVTAWVYDTIDQLRVGPRTGPARFTISDIVLLVPAAPPAP